jgi:hypothetical protein
MYISEGGKKIQSEINGNNNINNIKVTQKNKKKVSEQKSSDKFSNSNNIDRVELSPWAKFCKDSAKSNKSYKDRSNYSNKVELRPWDKFLKFFKSFFGSSNDVDKFVHGGGSRGRTSGSGGTWV